MFLFKVQCFFGAKNVINRAPTLFLLLVLRAERALQTQIRDCPLKGNPANIAVL